MLPLIHIGYHKTATTWLQENFFRNSQVGFAVRNGSDRIFREFVTRNPFLFEVTQVQAMLNKHLLPMPATPHVPVITQERLSGSPHTGGYDSQAIADRLKKVFPEARILIVVREQSGLILSGYKQYVRNGGQQSLARYMFPPENGWYHIPAFRFDFFEFHALVEYYQALFGEPQVLVLPYELFVNQPNVFLKTILEFNGLEYNEALVSALPLQQRSHPSLSFLFTNFKRHLGRLADVESRYQSRSLLAITPEMRHGLLTMLERLDGRLPLGLRKSSDRQAQAYIQEKTKDRYNASNARVGQLAHLALADFGYKVQPNL